ncbi:MAG: ribonuclease HI family protein [bacterium]|nr:ribonuclease HI family protein [bacterium]
MDKGSSIIVYTDGGSRGNPGPAAFGVVIKYDGEKKEYGETIGRATNNQAEYQGVVFGLKKVKQLLGKERAKESIVEVRSDSELLVKQLNGVYKVMDEYIQKVWMEIWNMRMEFKQVIFKHVYREDNQEADRMVNIALDKEQDKLL